MQCNTIETATEGTMIMVYRERWGSLQAVSSDSAALDSFRNLSAADRLCGCGNGRGWLRHFRSYPPTYIGAVFHHTTSPTYIWYSTTPPYNLSAAYSTC